jgi:hypothetical protein
MPYADPEQRKRVQRESAARRRAAVRASTAPNGMTSTPVIPVPSPSTTPTLAVLQRIGAMLGEGDLLRNETAAQYHARLRSKWKLIRHVLEE